MQELKNAATKQNIEKWFLKGIDDGKSYMLVLHDDFDDFDFPSYFDSAETAKAVKVDPGKGYRVVECYDLNKDMQEQLDQHRCWAL